MNNISCCFTGHRKIPNYDIPHIQKNLEILVKKLILQGVVNFYVGGALGFDTIAGKTIIKLKQYYPNIKLILALPCKNQSSLWSANDVKIYENIIVKADKIIYVSEKYFKGCMHKRNRFMVDNSDFCIFYLTCSTGGTYYTVNYAKQKNLNLIDIINTC